MIEYSLGLVAGYAAAKWTTPRFPSLKSKRFHLHHWMWSSLLLICLWLIYATATFSMMQNEWSSNLLIGTLTGVALQGLSYKNWSILRAN